MQTPRFHTFEDGAVWPLPGDEAQDSLEWRLRYKEHGVLTTDRYHAASIVSAYRQLIAMPSKRRNEVIAGLRAAQRRGV